MTADNLPASLPGHWDTAEGREMAVRYADTERPAMRLGSDLHLANAAFMELHEPLATATKERMRWLSVQLALAQAEVAAWKAQYDKATVRTAKYAREAKAAAIRTVMEIEGEKNFLDDKFPDGGTFTIEHDGKTYLGVPFIRASETVVQLLLDASSVTTTARAPSNNEAWSIIDEMRRADEGTSITINCPNPDFEGPNEAVDVCAPWTDWQDRRFAGETVAQCLREAAAYRDSKS